MLDVIKNLFGDPNERFLKKLEPLVETINRLEPELEAVSDADLQERIADARADVADGASLDDVLSTVFAVVREMSKRTLGQRHYDEQLMGGIVMHQGKIAEMKTGEGKTLAATLPATLRALAGKGVHIVTVNDYLARRDAVWMGQIYDALGLTVACINGEGASYRYDPTHKVDESPAEQEEEQETASFRVEHHHLRPISRQEAYEADIVYGTNSEFGFDYLRDNLAQSLSELTHRGERHFVIIDEIDSVLIDEARTPLIISAPDEKSSDLYKTFARIVPQLSEEEHYVIDEKHKAVTLTDEGVERVEAMLDVDNLYTEGGIRMVHHLENALRAHAMFQRDKQYVVKDGDVVIVDEFTGRMMPGRRYSGGLHQAIEAKEGVRIQQESRTVASISIQNLFRMYNTIAGMTGTAATSAEEFEKVYDLGVVVVPTHKPLIRNNLPDRVYKTASAKFSAVVDEVREQHEAGRPVLVGTVSIEKNELVSAMLKRAGVPHKVLNAKNHEREAEIIAQAGRPGAVTVATNMAGRGVDIILGGNPPDPEEAQLVRESGGLHVVGTARHEARRIDDQLRGRAGRQGDPGSSRFFVSLEDEILRRMGGDRIRGLMERFQFPEDQPIEHGMVSRAIERAQAQVEGRNFDVRKHLLEYDDVLNTQRNAIYRRRRRVLEAAESEDDITVRDEILTMVDEEIEAMVAIHTMGDPLDWDIEHLFQELQAIGPVPSEMHQQLNGIAEATDKSVEERQEDIVRTLMAFLRAFYTAKVEAMGEEEAEQAERWVLLRTIDTLWMDHLDAMEHLRDSVRLRAYGQRDPLVEYKKEGRDMFDELLAQIRSSVVRTIFKVGVSG